MAKLQLSIVFGVFAAALGVSQRGPKTEIYDRPIMYASRNISQSLFIDNPYHDAGKWGGIDLCPNNGFATAAEITYRSPAFDHLDETAINGVRLYCNDPDGHNEGYVTSTVGTEGESQGEKICSSGFITGFRANTLEHQGALTDDVAVEDFEISCNYGMEIIDTCPDNTKRLKPQPYGFKTGVWSNFAECQTGSAVCGIQTRYEDASLGDATAVCEVTLFCCVIPATDGTNLSS